MDFWTFIGVISSILGIYSFARNDTSVFSFFKKTSSLFVCSEQTHLKKI